MAIRHFPLDSVLDGEKGGIPVADSATFRVHLHAHWRQSKVAKHFSAWSLFQAR